MLRWDKVKVFMHMKFKSRERDKMEVQDREEKVTSWMKKLKERIVMMSMLMMRKEK